MTPLDHAEPRTSRRPDAARARAARMAAVLATLALTVAACAAAPADAPAVGDASPIAGLPTGPAPDPGSAFTATTLDGGELESSALDAPVILWFWAPWCTICQAEGPGVAEVAAEFEGQIEIIGVAGLGSVEEMQAFVADTGTGELTHMIDADGSIWQRFGVTATPTHIFVSPDGDVDLQLGWMRAVDLRERIEELLG